MIKKLIMVLIVLFALSTNAYSLPHTTVSKYIGKECMINVMYDVFGVKWEGRGWGIILRTFQKDNIWYAKIKVYTGERIIVKCSSISKIELLED